MILKKKAKTFNDYDCTLSWGQIEVIAAALERDHSDPVSDELFAELHWYMERVPGPGEEEEDAKMREEGGAPAAGEGAQPPGEDDEMAVPMPPTEGAPEGAEQAPGEPGAEGDLEGEEPGEITGASVEKALSGEGSVPEPGLEEEAENPDERLAAPPAE